MKKKRAAQSGATGIRDTALGYAMNAKPGPAGREAEVRGATAQACVGPQHRHSDTRLYGTKWDRDRMSETGRDRKTE